MPTNRVLFDQTVLKPVTITAIDALALQAAASVYVYDDPDRMHLATLYTTEDGLTIKANPLTPDTWGRVYAWLPVGKVYYITIDQAGAPDIETAFPAFTDNGILYDKGGAWIHVKAFDSDATPCKGDGSDATAAIKAAWDFCLNFTSGYYSGVSSGDGGTIYRLKGPTLYLGPGDFGWDDPDGLDIDVLIQAKEFRLMGGGSEQTRISLTDDSYFIRCSNTVDISKFTVEGIEFLGGKGHINFLYTGPLARLRSIIRDVHCRDFTETAIGHLSSDMPLWDVNLCYFEGKHDLDPLSPTVNQYLGTALCFSGLTDGVHVRNTTFARFKYGIKIPAGGNNMRLSNVQFFRMARGVTRTNATHALWICPVVAGSSNLGEGFICRDTKFGNENLQTDDSHVLYALENTGVGTDALDRPHSTTPTTTEQVRQHVYDGCQWYGDSVNAPTVPFIRSYVSWLWGLVVRDLHVGGDPSAYVYEAPSATAGTRYNETIQIGPLLTNSHGLDQLAVRASNLPDVTVIDPYGVLDYDPAPQAWPVGGDRTEYTSLLASAVSGWTAGGIGPATTTTINDVDGVTGALTLTSVAAGDLVFAGLPALTVGKPVWIEFDARAGTASSLYFNVVQNGTEVVQFQRYIRLRAAWRRYRFKWVPRNAVGCYIAFRQPTAAVTADIGRVYVYHSREPVHMVPVVFGGAVTVLTGASVASLTVNGGPQVLAGAGAPVFAAANGSIYLRSDGGAGTTLYLRESGAWVTK